MPVSLSLFRCFFQTAGGASNLTLPEVDPVGPVAAVVGVGQGDGDSSRSETESESEFEVDSEVFVPQTPNASQVCWCYSSSDSESDLSWISAAGFTGRGALLHIAPTWSNFDPETSLGAGQGSQNPTLKATCMSPGGTCPGQTFLIRETPLA